jgi:hypothetical protein
VTVILCLVLLFDLLPFLEELARGIKHRHFDSRTR